MDTCIAIFALAASLLGLTFLQVDAQVTRGTSALATRAETYDATHRFVAATYDAPGDPVWSAHDTLRSLDSSMPNGVEFLPQLPRAVRLLMSFANRSSAS